MSSYLSNILTNTTSKYNTLRQNLTSSETDGDTEDDSHISRVLRAYYTEKGRQFPQWLPPDPRRTVSSQSVTSTFASSLRQPSSLSTATLSNTHTPQRGSLSDLWDQPSQRPAPPQQTMSLRRQAADRTGSNYQGRGGNDMLAPPQAQAPLPSQARPLPSQRQGSYQNAQSQQQYGDSPVMSPGAAGGTAQERLKARLWGRAGSSTNLTQGGQQPAQQQYGAGNSGAAYPSRDRFGPAGPR